MEVREQPHKTFSIVTDSKTEVHLRLHGKRTTMTVRILPEIKKAFTERTRELGLTTCHVTEGLIQGWLVLMNSDKNLVHPGLTINNLTLTREVKRARRYAVEEDEESSVIWREYEPKIIMPEERTVLDHVIVGKRKTEVSRPSWIGPRVDLEKELENWSMLSTEDRLYASRYARCFPNEKCASKVLAWYAAYRIHLKEKEEVSE